MRRYTQSGFSLTELVIVMAIAGILIVVGAPGLQAYIINQKITTQNNAIVKSLNFARSEAVARNTPQGIRITSKGPASGEWSAGWVIWEDGRQPGGAIDANRNLEETIREFTGEPAVLIFARDADQAPFANVNEVSFRSDGMLNNTTEVHFFVCHRDGERPGRHIRVRRTGHISLVNDEFTDPPCPSTP